MPRLLEGALTPFMASMDIRRDGVVRILCSPKVASQGLAVLREDVSTVVPEAAAEQRGVGQA
jgi:predicted transcriptional regulator